MKVLTRSLVALPLLAIVLGAGAPMYADTVVEGQLGGSGGIGSLYSTGALAGSAVSDSLPSWSFTCSTCSGYGISGNGAATVNDGSLGASASVTVTGTPGASFITADSSAGYTDTLTITGGTGSGVLELTYALDGVISNTGGLNDATLDLYSTLATNFQFDHEGIEGGSDVEIGANGTYTDTATFYYQFTYGTALPIEATLDAAAVFDPLVNSTPYTTTVNYYSTAAVTSALVFSGTPSAPGTENSAADIVSASGLDYGPTGVSVVTTPEPGTMSLTFLGAGLLGLMVLIRKREAQGRAQTT